MHRGGSLLVALALCGVAFTQAGMAQTEDHGARRTMEKVAPVYPELAKRAHIQGAVKLEVVVRPNGRVKSTTVLGEARR
jgi:outer membrane biosynthesis protein TonB